MNVGNLITGSSAFLKSSLNLCKFSVHVVLKPSLENFENYFAEWGPREAFWWLQPHEGPWARLPSQAASRLLTLRTSARFGVSTSFQQRHESVVACCWVRGTECNTVCTNPFEGGLHYLHYPHHSLALGQTTEGEHSLTHQQKIVLKIYWVWPHPSEQDPVSLTVNLSHQEASISLLSLSIRGQTEGKPQSEN